MASSFPKSFPHYFFSLFLTSHFAYCYYSKATGLVFWGFFLETDLRIFLQGMDFSRNVESYQKHVELISIQWQLHPGWKPKERAPPPPKKKIQTLSGKGGKIYQEKSREPRKCRDDWLNHKRKAHGRHQYQQITSISFHFYF